MLIRHGQTPSNVSGSLDTTIPGAGLTELGQAQAEAIPAALTGEEITAIYGSPMVRTQLTAAPLGQARGLDVQVLDGLEEVSAGAMEMRTDEEAVQAYRDAVSAWMHGELDEPMPGGPTGRDFWDRFDAAVDRIAERHGRESTVAVFSHGTAIRVFTTLAVGLSAEDGTAMRLSNTGMAVLEGYPGSGWDLVTWFSDPLGGEGLTDAAAQDVTGEEANRRS